MHPHDLSRPIDAGEIADDMHKLAIPNWPAHLRDRRGMLWVFRLVDWKRAFKQPVSVSLETKHRSAKNDGIDQRSANDVLDAIWLSASYKPLPGSLYKIRVFVASYLLSAAMSLTWRAGPDEVVPIEGHCQRVPLAENKRIARLIDNIDAVNIKPSQSETERRAALAAKQIEGSEYLGHDSTASLIGRWMEGSSGIQIEGFFSK